MQNVRRAVNLIKRRALNLIKRRATNLIKRRAPISVIPVLYITELSAHTGRYTVPYDEVIFKFERR